MTIEPPIDFCRYPKKVGDVYYKSIEELAEPAIGLDHSLIKSFYVHSGVYNDIIPEFILNCGWEEYVNIELYIKNIMRMHLCRNHREFSVMYVFHEIVLLKNGIILANGNCGSIEHSKIIK